MSLPCVVVGLIVATTNGSTLYYTSADPDKLASRDLIYELAEITDRDHWSVKVIDGLYRLTPRADVSRCRNDSLYAALVGAP